MERKKKKAGPLHGSPIEDYCMIGDCETAALVSREGSIDWLCWPTFSSAACFAALLGTRNHGHWQIAPAGKVKAVRRQYGAHTLVLETTFETKDGEVCLIDFMPPRERHSHVVRIVRGIRGRVAMQMDLAIRFDYGRTIPWVTSKDHELRAIAGDDMVTLRTKVPLRGEGMTTCGEFTVRKGQTVSFTLTGSSSLDKIPPEIQVEKALAKTQRFWKQWSRKNKYTGPYAEAVERSLITGPGADNLRYQWRAAACRVGGPLAAGISRLAAGADRQCGGGPVSTGCVWRGFGRFVEDARGRG